MRRRTALLVLSGLAVMAGAETTTHPVTITLGYDDGTKVCVVVKVHPMTVDVDPGEKVEWTGADLPGGRGMDPEIRVRN